MREILYVILAAVLDIFANRLIAMSHGFRKPLPGIGALICVAAAFFFLERAIQYMNLAIAYASWGAIGILGTAIMGHLFLKQPLSIRGKLGIACVLSAIVLLRNGA